MEAHEALFPPQEGVTTGDAVGLVTGDAVGATGAGVGLFVGLEVTGDAVGLVTGDGVGATGAGVGLFEGLEVTGAGVGNGLPRGGFAISEVN